VSAAAELREFVEKMYATRAGMGHAAVCPERLVLDHGQAWPASPKPRDVRWGRRGFCFMNALKLAWRRPELTYVEGYGAAHIPTPHAWCVDPDGRVVDPTWRPYPGVEHTYLGVPIKTDVATAVTVRLGHFGVLFTLGPSPLHELDPADYVREVKP